MQIENNKSLKAFNTFGIQATAKKFVAAHSLDELKKILATQDTSQLFILGGGSNMLLTGDLDKTVLHIALKGIAKIFEDDSHIHLKVNAGENWHNFVMYCVAHNFGGVENLSLIPGSVGAAPIQNIGAYGVELKDVFLSCTALNMKTLEEETFNLKDCEFGYRSSVFKEKYKGKYIITAVVLRLTKKEHNINTAYGAIEQELQKMGVVHPTIESVSKAVIAIRQSKLPDPKTLGNSGSFFKNPVVDVKTFKKFHQSFPDAPFYKVAENSYKIPAGWLIEQAGFKGKRFGDAGIHEKQALVLVNYGNATGQDILELAKRIQSEIQEKFGITIEPEVNVVGCRL
ncbi:MAG TPA: UDP-N-acetylmuramate dehydrogenase [Flavobacteriaceae bacterium]|nr:UDP-N-acetylmuramate dehydrogenase [Flavobacteriaceae bacterium]